MSAPAAAHGSRLTPAYEAAYQAAVLVVPKPKWSYDETKTDYPWVANAVISSDDRIPDGHWDMTAFEVVYKNALRALLPGGRLLEDGRNERQLRQDAAQYMRQRADVVTTAELDAWRIRHPDWYYRFESVGHTNVKFDYLQEQYTHYMVMARALFYGYPGWNDRSINAGIQHPQNVILNDIACEAVIAAAYGCGPIDGAQQANPQSDGPIDSNYEEQVVGRNDHILLLLLDMRHYIKMRETQIRQWAPTDNHISKMLEDLIPTGVLQELDKRLHWATELTGYSAPKGGWILSITHGVNRVPWEARGMEILLHHCVSERNLSARDLANMRVAGAVDAIANTRVGPPDRRQQIGVSAMQIIQSMLDPFHSTEVEPTPYARAQHAERVAEREAQIQLIRAIRAENEFKQERAHAHQVRQNRYEMARRNTGTRAVPSDADALADQLDQMAMLGPQEPEPAWPEDIERLEGPANALLQRPTGRHPQGIDTKRNSELDRERGLTFAGQLHPLAYVPAHPRKFKPLRLHAINDMLDNVVDVDMDRTAKRRLAQSIAALLTQAEDEPPTNQQRRE